MQFAGAFPVFFKKKIRTRSIISILNHFLITKWLYAMMTVIEPISYANSKK